MQWHKSQIYTWPCAAKIETHLRTTIQNEQRRMNLRTKLTLGIVALSLSYDIVALLVALQMRLLFSNLQKANILCYYFILLEKDIMIVLYTQIAIMHMFWENQNKVIFIWGENSSLHITIIRDQCILSTEEMQNSKMALQSEDSIT